MTDQGDETITIEEALDQVEPEQNRQNLKIDVGSLGTEDMEDLLEGASEVGAKRFNLYLSPRDESGFDELVEYVETALDQKGYGFSEYAVCPQDGLTDEDLGSPYSKIILNRIPENHGASLAVPDEKLYEI